MKRFYYSLFAAATMLLATTSCSQEEDFTQQSSGEMATFEVSLEGASQSRAAGDGSTAKKLYFEVYQGTRKVIDNYAAEDEQTIGSYSTPVDLKDGKAEIKLPLLRGEKYKIMFWAQAESGSIYEPTDLTAIQVNYKDENNVNQTLANIEEYDAFFFGDAEFQASANVTKITLRRPFAQLNIGTTETDWKTAISMIDGTNLPVTTSEVTVTGLANQFNVLTGAATGEETVTFKQNALLPVNNDKGEQIDVEEFQATVNNEKNDYRYLAMNYLLVNGTATSTSGTAVTNTTDVTATFWRGNQLLFSIEKTNLANVPIQRNWRTNILGNLLSDPKTFTIEIDEVFENDKNIEIEIFADGIVKDAEDIYHITKPEGLYSLANLLNNASRAAFDYTFKGQTFVLDCDIDLQGAEWTPMNGFDGTFDGKEKTIKNFTAEAAQSAGLFGSLGTSAVIKNLKVEDATITGNHYAGVIAGFGYATIDNCHVKNSTVTLTTEWTGTKWDNGDKAGAIIGYLCEEMGKTEDIGKDHVMNCTADHVTIRGYRDIGGLVGIANGTATVSGNTITNSVVIIDKTNNPEGYTDNAQFNGGDVVGRISEKATVKNNTATEVKVEYIGGEQYLGYYQDANGNYIVTEGQGITNLIEANITDINLADGEIIIPDVNSYKGKTLTFTGSRNAVLDLTPVADNYQQVSEATLTFNGITVKFGNENYKGLQHAKAVTYNDCAINGMQFLYAPTTFTNCDFNSNGAEHCVWTYGSSEVNFTDCNFTYGDRAVNCYLEDPKDNSVTVNVNFSGCEFTKVAGEETTGAIETNSYFMKKLNLNITNCTVNEGDLWWVSKWDDKNGENTVSTIDGKRIVTTNGQLKAAAAEGLTEISLTEGTFEIPSTVAGKTITFNGMGDGTKFDFTKAYNVGDAAITFKNLYIEGKNENAMNGYGIQHTSKTIKYENCTLNNAITNENNGNVEYIRCTFTGTYYIATYAVKSAKFTNCTFDREDSRAVLVYSHGNNPCVVTLDGCEFKAKAKGYTGVPAWTAAVEVDTSNITSEGTTVTITNCTADANYNGIVRDKSAAGKANAVITVDSKTYIADGLYKIAEGEYELYKATGLSYNFGSQKATIKLINDIEGTVVMKSNLTIDGQNYKIDAINLNGAANLTLKNITFDAAKAVNSYDRRNGGTARQYANIISGDKTNNPNIGARDLTIDNCTFEGTFTNAGAAIAFTDRSRPTGGSGNVTIKNCTFNTQGGNYDIYAYYTAGTSNNGYFIIDNNEFKSGIQGKPVYLGNIQANSPITVKNNDFVNVASLADAVFYQGEGNHKPTLTDSGNSFATANE